MKGGLFKLVILPILVFGIGIASYMYYTGSYNSTTDNNLEFIKSHINSKGKLVDLQSKIEVKGVEDIRFYFGDKVTIEFGKILLKWEKEEFLTKTTRDRLESIGITMRVNKNTNKIHLFYKGEEIVRWVS